MPNFDKAAWRGQYPRFATIPDDQLNGFIQQSYIYFAECHDACNNRNNCNECRGQKQQIRFLLVAHIAELESRNAGGGGMIGAITNASEGSVSIGSTVVGDASNIPPFFAQTSYGIAFWQATVSLRSAFYVPRRPNFRRISFP